MPPALQAEMIAVMQALGVDAGGGVRGPVTAEAVRPWGVDVSTGVESQPGVKDPRLVRSFIHAARDAEDPVRRAEGPGPFDWDMD